MSDYEDEGFESLEEYQEQEEDRFGEEDEDWSDSLDDMESDDWSEQFGRGAMDLEDLDADDDFGDEEVDDIDLERIERDYFDEDEGSAEVAPRPGGNPGGATGTTGGSRRPGPGGTTGPGTAPGENPDGDSAGAEEPGDLLIDRYVALKSQLQAIQKELKELKPRVVAAISEAGGVVEENLGTVKVAKRPKWKYSDDVARLQEELKEKKKREREAGVAEVSDETAYLLVQRGGGQRGE